MDKGSCKKSPLSKIDPSFKSKRYRDKLRTEIKALENLIPVDKSSLHRKLDSQTVFRLVLSFLRTHLVFKGHLNHREEESISKSAENCRDDLVQKCLRDSNFIKALDGFLLILTTDGNILYVTENVQDYLGFSQTDLLHRCMYGILHPTDRSDMKNTLEQAYDQHTRLFSIMCRMRCFNGSHPGHVKMHCSGKIKYSSSLKSSKTSSYVAYVFCHPFMTIQGAENSNRLKQDVFWSRHDMDLTFKEIDQKALEVLGYQSDDITGKSFYALIHPDDLATCVSCHKDLLESSNIQTLHFRLQTMTGDWCWLYSRGKVVSRNSKKCSIVFSHCPVREEDNVFIQEEYSGRQKYTFHELRAMKRHHSAFQDSLAHQVKGEHEPLASCPSDCSRDYCCVSLLQDICPSSWHVTADRHSPLLPSSHMTHKVSQREKLIQFNEFKRKQRQVYPVDWKREYDSSQGRYIYADNTTNNYHQDHVPSAYCSSHNDSSYRHLCSEHSGNEYAFIGHESLHPARNYQHLVETQAINNFPYFMTSRVPRVQFAHSSTSNVLVPGNNSKVGRNSDISPSNQSLNQLTNDVLVQNYNFPMVPKYKQSAQFNNHSHHMQSFCPPNYVNPHGSKYFPPGYTDKQYNCNQMNMPYNNCCPVDGNVFHYDIEASVHMKIVDHKNRSYNFACNCNPAHCSGFPGFLNA